MIRDGPKNVRSPAEVVALLKPLPSVSKLVSGRGRWMVGGSRIGKPFYCGVIEGHIRINVRGRLPQVINPGDFVLVPAIVDFSTSSLELPGVSDSYHRVKVSPGEYCLGENGGPPDVQMLPGHCDFATPDSALLVSLLPEVVQVSGEERLTALVRMIHEETLAERAAGALVLRRLPEVLLNEALRCGAGQRRRRVCCVA